MGMVAQEEKADVFMIADEKAFARLLHIVTTVPISYYEPEENRSTIQECENISSVADIGVLNYTMLIDFCRRVEETKRPKGVSREVFDAIQYITRRTNEPIQMGDVAEHVHRSRSWLGERFKAELGTDVSSYIMNAQLEEARNLLTHSEKSLAEISNYLCFSSQAYFQNVFKKKFGITPTQYRKDSRKMR